MTTYTVSPTGTNDQTPINAALTSAASNPGSIVYLNAGTYDIRSSLIIGNNTELTGATGAILRIANGMTWAAQIPVIKQSSTSVQNIKIHGFEINCNRDNQVGGEGDGLFNGIGLSGYTGSFGNNISIYDMYIHDSLGDGARIKYVNNFIAYNNHIDNMGHEGIYGIEIVGGDIYNNDHIQKDNSAIRLDNSQNVNIHDNVSHRTARDDKNGNSAIQIGNQPASLGHTRQTSNIKIYNNVIYDGACSGIMLMDADHSSGTTAQTVHIYNNTLTSAEGLGCGWMTNVKYNAGISVWNWGNGAVIEFNNITGSYNGGIVIQDAIASGCTLQVNNNNITNSKRTLATDPARMLPVSGYGILNMVPSKMTVRAETNYMTGNVTGDFYQVTPISSSASPNTVYTPGSPVPVPETPITRYIPPIRIIQEELDDYYIEGHPKLGYINGVPVYWQKKAVDVAKSIGQKKAPGCVGWNLTDFDFAGAELTVDCFSRSIDELYEVLAAFYDTTRGRAIFELGGAYTGKQVSGLAINHSSSLRLSTDIPERSHPYSLLFLLDKPYLESTTKKVRGKHVYGTTEWTADDCYAGNILKNPSFEEWTKSTEMDFVLGSSAADNEWRCVRWSPELHQFCAVAATALTENTKIMTSSDGDTWAIPAGLTTAANHENRWRGLAWGSSIGLSAGEPLPGRWVAVGYTGTGDRSIYSDEGVDWTAGGTTPDNAWGSVCYVRDDANSVYRYVAVSYGTSDANPHRVIYSDDGAVTWTDVASADDTYGLWLSVCYAESINTLVAVAYNGTAGKRAMYSTDHGATWTLADTPANQKWTNVIWAEQLELFVACSEDGVQQIMTSPEGINWTLQDTPVAGSVVVPGTGTDVATTVYTTPTGYKYSTSLTTYTLDAAPTMTVAALTNGHIWRLDDVYFYLRTTVTGGTAYIKITAETASIAETTLCEASTTAIDFVHHVHDLNFETAANEAITLKVYMKSSSTDRKAVSTLIGYTVTEFNGAGGSSISYNYNEWRSITWSPENELLVCVAQTSTEGDSTKRAMVSADAINWTLIDTPADNYWLSICYSPYLNKFVAVGYSGTGNRVMSSDSYGSITNATSWISETAGQSRSDAAARSGSYGLQIVGDGVTEDVGRTTQYTKFDPGVSYVLSAWGSATGLTTGKLAVDVFSGNSIILQLLWDADCEYTQLQDTLRFDAAPTDAYIRVHGIDTPNLEAVFSCDDLLLEKASDFELSTTGSDITTLGHVDVTPDVEIVAVTSSSGSNITTGRTYTRTDGDVHSRYETTYTEDYSVVLPALTDGKYYRFDKFSAYIATGNTSGVTGYLKVTMQLGAGTEKQVMAWSSTARLPNYTFKSLNTELYSVTNQAVTLNWYLKTTNSAVKATANDISFTYTEIIPTVQSSAISIYNKADSLTVLDCCNELRPGCKICINADGTGNYQYTENFADEQYEYTVSDSSGITYITDENAILVSASGYLIYKFDTKYPITGIPFMAINTVSGAPLIHIAADNAGSPGTWYAVDGNSTTNIENDQAYRLLNSGTTLILNGLTKYHLKITSGGTAELKVNSLFMYGDIITIDAEHPKIYKGQVNTFKALVTSTSSAIINLKFRDADLLV